MQANPNRAVSLVCEAYDIIASMAKKKHSPKKHTFKHATAPTPEGVMAATPRTAVMPNAEVTSDGRSFEYVGRDVRRLTLFAGILIGLELLLWYVIDFTSVGARLYSFLHL